MKIDTSKSAAQNVLDLILNSNPGATGLVVNSIDFSAPVVEAGTGTRNTRVTLTMKANQRYKGSQSFSYERRAVYDAIAAPVTSFAWDDTTTWANLKTTVAQGLGVRADEITFDDLPDAGGNAVTWNEEEGQAYSQGVGYATLAALYGPDDRLGPDFTVVAKEGSLLYFGSVVLDLTWDSNGLEQLIDDILPGFLINQEAGGTGQQLIVVRPREENWAGEMENAGPTSAGLSANSVTWEDLPETWETWDAWNEPVYSDIVFRSRAIDIGSVQNVLMTIDGSYQGHADYFYQTSADGVNWDAEQPLTKTIINTRYIRGVVKVNDDAPIIRRLLITVYSV